MSASFNNISLFKNNNDLFLKKRSKNNFCKRGTVMSRLWKNIFKKKYTWREILSLLLIRYCNFLDLNESFLEKKCCRYETAQFSSFWILIPESSHKSREILAGGCGAIRRPFPSHYGGKPVCGFSRNLWWLNVRSSRRCDDFIDLPASIAVSSDKLDYDFMPRAATTWTNRADCRSRERERRRWALRALNKAFLDVFSRHDNY